MKLRLPMLAATSDVTALVIISMALQTGDVKKRPRARAAARAVVSAPEPAALTMRATAPPPAAAGATFETRRAKAIVPAIGGCATVLILFKRANPPARGWHGPSPSPCP